MGNRLDIIVVGYFASMFSCLGYFVDYVSIVLGELVCKIPCKSANLIY